MVNLADIKKLLGLSEKEDVAFDRTNDETIKELITAFGGKENIFSIDACLTRLRVEVINLSLVNVDKIQQLGAIGVITVGHEVQAIFGKNSDNLRKDLERWFSMSFD